MPWLRWSIVGIGTVLGGFMAIDGLRALIAGDFLTPRSGPHAGQLGPWAGAVASVGLDPRSSTVKGVFLVYGICWLALVAAYAAGQAWSWWALLAVSILTLWYLPVGTGLALLELALLVVVHFRTP